MYISCVNLHVRLISSEFFPWLTPYSSPMMITSVLLLLALHCGVKISSIFAVCSRIYLYINSVRVSWRVLRREGGATGSFTLSVSLRDSGRPPRALQLQYIGSSGKLCWCPDRRGFHNGWSEHMVPVYLEPDPAAAAAAADVAESESGRYIYIAYNSREMRAELGPSLTLHK